MTPLLVLAIVAYLVARHTDTDALGVAVSAVMLAPLVLAVGSLL